MNPKFIIIWSTVLIVGIGVVTAFWYNISVSHTVSMPNAIPEVSQPSGTNSPLPISQTTVTASNTTTSSSTATSSSQSDATMVLADQNGNQVTLRDFLHNGTTIPDTANPGHYLLAGNLGYCPLDPQKCQAAPSNDFSIYYNSGPQSFTIALTAEPIGQSRLDMEQFLLATLGVTQQQLCNLNYFVGVTRYVNAQFTAKNLGFSSCPGAVALP